MVEGSDKKCGNLQNAGAGADTEGDARSIPRKHGQGFTAN